MKYFLNQARTRTFTAAALALMIGSQAFAASSGNLPISGTVAAVNNVTINAQSAATSLNITSGSTDTLIATVDEQSNSLTGYSITLSSANSGELRNTSDSAKKTTYQLKYDGGSAFTPSAGGSVVKNVSSLTGLTTDSSDLTITVASYAAAPAGSYTDTITISIAAN